jgi:hypothetical protein
VVTGAAVLAAIGCVVGDVSLLAAFAGDRLPAVGPDPLLVGAAAASAVRLSAAGWAGCRVARLRAAES